MSKLNCMTKACGVFLLWAATAIALPAQTFTRLANLGKPNGQFTGAGLVQATNGDFYGTTLDGGRTHNGIPGNGTVFKITATGTLTSLHTFQGGITDGDYPEAGLIQATNGDLYGTTAFGGAGGAGGGPGGGTAFKITPNGALTLLYSFCSQSNCTDGQYPEAGLVQGTNGNFYGTTSEGGANDSSTCVYGCGTVFTITPTGALTTLYNFCAQGGCSDGSGPSAALVQATSGNFYGTTGTGGAYGYGTVFTITPSGALTTLYSFCSQTNCTDGANPTAGLVQATDGNLYGTTLYGETNSACTGNCGTIFQVTPSGTLTTLYSLCSQSNCTDGQFPEAGLIQGTNGTFYGTTDEGGAKKVGTVFSLSVGLGPFVETLPTFGKVRAPVKILGTNLTGATSVTFNGTAATYTVVSSSEITTTVPTGATTGTVQVVTPSNGTLKSNVVFRVLP